MKTVTYKDQGAWNSQSELNLDDNMILRIRTSKRYGGKLVTTASVWKRTDTGMISHLMLNDFNETIETTAPKRITEAVCRSQHDNALCQIEAIKVRAIAHYILKDAAA